MKQDDLVLMVIVQCLRDYRHSLLELYHTVSSPALLLERTRYIKHLVVRQLPMNIGVRLTYCIEDIIII